MSTARIRAAIEEAERVGALVVPCTDRAKVLTAWMERCYRLDIAYIAVKVYKHFAVVETNTDPKTDRRGCFPMTDAARERVREVLRPFVISGLMGPFTYARVPNECVQRLVPELVRLFNAPDAYPEYSLADETADSMSEHR